MRESSEKPNLWATSHDTLPSPTETETFIDAGYEVDSNGRPLHPSWKEMLSNESIGAIIGKGKYYNWGPNYTVDPVIIAGNTNRKVLLIQRKDNGNWALPGGFIDNDEQDLSAAYRELGEETGLVNIGKPTARIYKGIVADPRTTIHAWPETTAYLWNIESPLDICPGDDAADAKWFSENNLPANLHGSHAEIIKLALEYQKPTDLKGIISLPTELLTFKPASGGHMAYGHLLVDGPHDRLFIKAYDPDQFTDEQRREHSLAYLQKEQLYFEHLRANNYKEIPERSELIDNKILAMDAFHTDDGWSWQVPIDIDIAPKYISDILDTFKKLNDIPLPKNDYHETVKPTYLTLWEEGWKSIDDQKISDINEKIRSFYDQFSPDLQKSTVALLNNLKNMRSTALSSEQPDDFVLSHNDARQSNIAWHLDHGVKLIDWSWADIAPINADSTMFLIDLAKSGYDVNPYLNDHFNNDHALALAGFWLAHSLWPTRDGSDIIRKQQITSAATAYELTIKKPRP